MTDLAGKVAVVTGASRGLGAGVASRLAKHGATLVSERPVARHMSWRRTLDRPRASRYCVTL
jgi:NAD(P)-dependent dehydrogenase (short-subunit alcohol dehydrogenase family)